MSDLCAGQGRQHGQGQPDNNRGNRGILCLHKLLHERGCQLPHPENALVSDNAQLLSYMLDHGPEDPDWPAMLYSSVNFNAAKCLQMLYDRVCLPRDHSFWSVMGPFASVNGKLSSRMESLKVMVANGGRPPSALLSTATAASQGLECLRFVRELGAEWEPGTMRAAHRCVETMRYARDNGCPWGDARLSHFAGSLACLRFAHENGCEYDEVLHDRTVPVWLLFRDFEVLHYVCEDMNLAWAEGFIAKSAKVCLSAVSDAQDRIEATKNMDYREFLYRIQMASHCRPVSTQWYIDWWVPLYIKKQKMDIGYMEMALLEQLAGARPRERVAALAECFYGAKKLVRKLLREGQEGPRVKALYNMSQCPSEVVERIGIMADSVVPWGRRV